MTLNGVDVASFQGAPGQWRSAAGEIDWAAVKLTELSPNGSAYVSPTAAADWAWLKANGKARIAYFFAHPKALAAGTAALFTATLNTFGLDDGDAVCMDLETSDGLTPASVSAWSKTVLARVRRDTRRIPVVYTFRDFAAEGYCNGLEHYPLWVADLDHPAGHPEVPLPWTHWAIHQYVTSGAIDRDIANYPTIAVMQAALGRVRHRAAHQEDNDMFYPLPAGGRAVFPVWVDAGKVGAQAPYKNVSMVVAGDTGADVTITFYAVDTATAPEVRKLTLAAGVSQAAEPKAGWAKVQAVALARTDTTTTAAASAVMTRW